MPRFNMSPASIAKWRIEFFFDIYRRCIALQDELVEDSFQEWQERIDEEAQRYDPETREIFYDYHADEYTAREHAKGFFMNAIFVASYALYEHHRKRVEDIFSVTGLNDPRISALLSTPEWEEIKTCKTIRDKIMHEGGKLPDCTQAVEYAERKGIRGDHLSGDGYVITHQFCEESLNNYQRFLLKAIAELGDADESGDTR